MGLWHFQNMECGSFLYSFISFSVAHFSSSQHPHRSIPALQGKSSRSHAYASVYKIHTALKPREGKCKTGKRGKTAKMRCKAEREIIVISVCVCLVRRRTHPGGNPRYTRHIPWCRAGGVFVRITCQSDAAMR